MAASRQDQQTATPKDTHPAPKNPESAKSRAETPNTIALEIAQELKTESAKAYGLIHKPFFPVKNKSLKHFVTIESLPQTTFHKIDKVIDSYESNPLKLKKSYFKKNPPSNSQPDAIYMSELEAFCAEAYGILDHRTPNTYAVLDENNQYVGVLSEELPDFKPTSVQPVKLEDINTDFIHKKNLSITILDYYDGELKKIEQTLIEDEQQLLRLDENEKTIQKKLNALREQDEPATQDHFSVLLQALEINSQTKHTITKAKCSHSLELLQIQESMAKEHLITKKEMRSYRIVKGLAIGLTASYIYMEDDLHNKNMDMFGRRIDFDMSLWPVLYNFKDCNIFDFTVRRPTETTLIAQEADIAHFPNLKIAFPYYWPTVPNHVLKPILSLSTNAFTPDESRVYQQLEQNPYFSYHKYSVFLKFILLTANTYRNLASLHIRREAQTKDGLRIIDQLTTVMDKRIKSVESALIKTPGFIEFIARHYKTAIKQISTEILARNQSFYQLIKEAKNESIAILQEVERLQKLEVTLQAEMLVLNKQLSQITVASSEKKQEDNEAENTIRLKNQKIEELEKLRDALKTKIFELRHQKLIEKSYEAQIIKIHDLEASFAKLIKKINPEEKLEALNKNNVDGGAGILDEEKTPKRKLQFIQLKQKVIAEMNDYLPQSAFSIFNNTLLNFKTHKDLAEKIKRITENYVLPSNDAAANAAGIQSIKSLLEVEKQALKEGAFRTKINELLAFIENNGETPTATPVVFAVK